MGFSSSERTRGGGTEFAEGSTAGEITAGGVLTLGADGGTLGGELRGGGEETGGDESSFDVGGGEVESVRGFWTSGVGGPEWT